MRATQTWWTAWGMTVRLVVADPAALRRARQLVRAELANIEDACLRSTSELTRVHQAAGRPARISPLLAELVRASLAAARATEGYVDPTVGSTLLRLRYAGQTAVPTCGSTVGVLRRPAPRWYTVDLADEWLCLPPDVWLDLGAVAAARAADRAARLIAADCRVAAMVSVGDDVATAGPAPRGGWLPAMPRRADDPYAGLSLPAGQALATSYGWGLVDPYTGALADRAWRSVSVAAPDGVLAHALAMAAQLHGRYAPSWLAERGVNARLVSLDGAEHLIGGWPWRLRPAVGAHRRREPEVSPVPAG